MSKQTGSAFPLVVGLSVLLVGSGGAQAADSWLGTWKLNVAKSKYSPGPAPKSQTSHFEAVAGGGVKITVDGVDSAGKATTPKSSPCSTAKKPSTKGRR